MSSCSNDVPPGLELAEDEDIMDLENDEDYSDSENFEESTKCLFCDKIDSNIDNAVQHIKSDHKIDLNLLKLKFSMDQYSYIKLINFIRINQIKAEVIQSTETILWEDDKYFKPLEYEPWLSYDFEEMNSIADTKTSNISENMSEKEKNELSRETIVKLKNEIKEKDELLRNAMEDIEKMRKSFQRLVSNDSNKVNSSSDQRSSVANVSLKDDEGYFNSYAHYSMHHEMLSDKIRTESYRDAVLKNKEFFKDKVVLDVGCGTGILSMFASEAGAKTVIAIDNSEIIYNAIDIAKSNNIENIQFIKGRLENTELPVDKFDIIISEWMGYFLIFEGMLDSIIYARNRHLKLGGTLMPNRCTLNLAGYADKSQHEKYITFWDSVYGYSMSSMITQVLPEPLIEICNPDNMLTDYNIIVDYDLNKVNLNYSNFQYDFNLKCKKTEKLTAFVSHFDTFFDLPESVMFSTGMESKPTHWKQVVFFLKEPVLCNKDDIIKGRITCRRSKDDLRSVDIRINVFNQELSYYIN